MPKFIARGLGKTYQDGATLTVALDRVTFDIEDGEFLAIMGPSGSGKSTLLHLLGFLDRHTEGEYLYDARALDDLSDDELARFRNEEMGFVFQSFNLLSRTSVIDNVKLPLLYSRVPEEKWHDRVLASVHSVGLSHRLHHEPSELSGGERQRVAIARALVTLPKVIFADEPTGNLDTESGRAIMDILAKLNREEGKTVILITHEDDIAEYARRIMRLRDGKIESDVYKEK